MYCSSCGRDNDINDCIHSVKYNEKDQLFLLILTIALPTSIFGIYFNIYLDYDLINYLEVGSISISLILIILLAMYYLFGKLYIAIFFGCHQKVERSLVLFKKPYVLCARCTGILVGMFGTFFISLFDFNYFWLLLFTIPLIIDGVVQKRTKYLSNNSKRFITGLLAGPSFVLLFGGLHFLISRFIVTLVLNYI